MTTTTQIAVSIEADTAEEQTQKTIDLVQAINFKMGTNCTHFDSNQISCDVEELERVKDYLWDRDISFKRI